jgi:hypothetical protein
VLAGYTEYLCPNCFHSSSRTVSWFNSTTLKKNRIIFHNMLQLNKPPFFTISYKLKKCWKLMMKRKPTSGVWWFNNLQVCDVLISTQVMMSLSLMYLSVSLSHVHTNSNDEFIDTSSVMPKDLTVHYTSSECKGKDKHNKNLITLSKKWVNTGPWICLGSAVGV